MLASYISVGSRINFMLRHCCVYILVRFRHNNFLVTARTMSCFGLKYLILSPQAWLENVKTRWSCKGLSTYFWPHTGNIPQYLILLHMWNHFSWISMLKCAEATGHLVNKCCLLSQSPGEEINQSASLLTTWGGGDLFSVQDGRKHQFNSNKQT